MRVKQRTCGTLVADLVARQERFKVGYQPPSIAALFDEVKAEAQALLRVTTRFQR